MDTLFMTAYACGSPDVVDVTCEILLVTSSGCANIKEGYCGKASCVVTASYLSNIIFPGLENLGITGLLWRDALSR